MASKYNKMRNADLAHQLQVEANEGLKDTYEKIRKFIVPYPYMQGSHYTPIRIFVAKNRSSETNYSYNFRLDRCYIPFTDESTINKLKKMLKADGIKIKTFFVTSKDNPDYYCGKMLSCKWNENNAKCAIM